ncbi:MAG: hypothetical protein ABI863_19500 [Ginsengibacter sp.]
MKYIIAILLIVTIAVQTFSKWIVIATYEINKDYIASNLCINKAKPSCCCKGKCFLQKKLVADEDQQQPTGNSAHPDTQFEFFLQKPVQIDFRLPALSNRYNFYYLNGSSQEFAPSFFQPPQC